ncbi:MAG: ATP-dependent 6-phosphofructokinase [Alphaproteobacteria bacterium]|nr:ATP-dependent 6-phosphofructokinase [Alphaproteobacteria bacterium]
MSESKRIGILTSGGDCAGLNAVLRAAVHHATGLGWTVFGIEHGTQGLMDSPPRARKLDIADFDGTIIRRGGTILGTTNYGNPFAYPQRDGADLDRSDEVIAGYRALELDALIGIGGDGSIGILDRLAQKGGLNLVCIPKTIDNDVSATEVSIGYDTAVQVATDALDMLQPTAASHDRVMILEVMGRDAGHIALVAGIAGGADVILIPEIPYRIANVVRKIKGLQEAGKHFALVVVAEAVPNEAGNKIVQKFAGGRSAYSGIGHLLGDRLAETTHAEVRVTVLGHVQRGAAPDARDRLMAAVFGVHAVELIAQEKFGRMVAWRDRHVVDVPISEAIAEPALVDVDGPVVRTARGLGICLGDQ